MTTHTGVVAAVDQQVGIVVDFQCRALPNDAKIGGASRFGTSNICERKSFVAASVAPPWTANCSHVCFQYKEKKKKKCLNDKETLLIIWLRFTHNHHCSHVNYGVSFSGIWRGLAHTFAHVARHRRLPIAPSVALVLQIDGHQREAGLAFNCQICQVPLKSNKIIGNSTKSVDVLRKIIRLLCHSSVQHLL